MQLYSTDEYRASKKWPYAVCAGCIVYKQTATGIQVLLLERAAENERTEQDVATYHLPKGHVGFNETLMQTAVREVKEETGCSVEIETYLGALQREYIYKGDNFNRTFHFFAAALQSEESGMDDEHDGKFWVNPDNAVKLLGKPNPKGEDEVVYRFIQYLELTRPNNV